MTLNVFMIDRKYQWNFVHVRVTNLSNSVCFLNLIKWYGILCFKKYADDWQCRRIHLPPEYDPPPRKSPLPVSMNKSELFGEKYSEQCVLQFWKWLFIECFRIISFENSSMWRNVSLQKSVLHYKKATRKLNHLTKVIWLC